MKTKTSKHKKLREEYEKFMEGKDGKSLEGQFDGIFTDISKRTTFQ